MANTRETMGEQACLDALVANTLTSFEDDGVTKVGANCLRYHTVLTDVTLSQCKSVESYGLAGCTALTTVDMLGGSAGTIGGNAFNGDSALAHLILRGGSMTTLANTSAFTGTPISFYEGAVYVPQNQLATYKANDIWKNYLITTTDKYPLSNFEGIEDSWSDIIAASANDTYDSKYAVGDVKSMVIDGTKYYFQLVAKDADVLASDGTTTVPMTWLMYRKFYATTHRMNQDNNSGASGTGGNDGWAASEMRSWLSETVLPLLPSEVKSGIKEVRKYSDNWPAGGSALVHDDVTADKLWIPSAREVLGGSNYEQAGPIYNTVLSDNSSRVKYDQSGSATYWWLRSASSASSFYRINSVGAGNSTSASSLHGVVIGFCI